MRGTLPALKKPVTCRREDSEAHSVSQSAQAAEQSTYNTLCGLNNRHFFLTELEAGSPRSRYHGFLVRAHFLACRLGALVEMQILIFSIWDGA